MRNTIHEPFQLWFPGKKLWELWFVDPRKGVLLVDTCEDPGLITFHKGIRLKVLALPTNSQNCEVFYSSAFGERELLKEALDQVKLTGNEYDIEGIGVEPISGFPPKTLTRIDVPYVANFMSEFPSNLDPDMILPAPALIKIPENDIAIWTELGKQVIAFDRHGATLSYSMISGEREVDRARDVSGLMKSLKSKKLLADNPVLHIWNKENIEVYKEVLSGEVYGGCRPDPSRLNPTVGLRPRAYRDRQKQKAKKNFASFKKLAAGFAIVGLALLSSSSYSLTLIQTKQQKEAIAMKTVVANRLDLIKSQWNEMASAVDPNASVLEVWRKISTMPTSSKINISRMSISKDTIELTCEAMSDSVALNYVDELEKIGSFNGFQWVQNVVETLRDGTVLFIVKGSNYNANS